MIVIGLTGGIACGKTRAGAYLARGGVPVCEADELAHACIAPGGPAYGPLVRRFGRGILRPDGSVDRVRLGRRVFENPVELQALNRIVHPCVRDAQRKWLRAMRRRGEMRVAVIVPLLFEAGFDEGSDMIVCVAAAAAVQRERLVRRGLTRRDAERRIAAQWPLAEKAARSDVVWINNGPAGLLEQQVSRLLAQPGA